jgi:hypothetical protein
MFDACSGLSAREKDGHRMSAPEKIHKKWVRIEPPENNYVMGWMRVF